MIFPEAVKVQRFCLTLVGEARNWYATLEPIAMNWQELQTMFRQQYSKIGNTREQLFHAWRSFHYDENVETPDAYVIRIKQVATLLGYGDPQVLEVFKNMVPNRLYWVLFSIDNLHDAVETAKRFLTKEKIDRQMMGQSSTPFMRLMEKRRKSVSFDANDVLEKTNENIIVIEKWIGLGKTRECGDNLGQEKEVEEARVNHHLVLDRGREQIQIEIALGVLDVESMIILLMNVLIKLQMSQIRRAIVKDRCRCIWQIVIQDQM